MTVTDEQEVAHVGADDVELLDGDRVGDFTVRAKIGEGGFGTVYRAEHPLIGKQVAVKVLGRRYSADPEVVSRFVAEARAVNQIRHRNIIDIFGFGQLEDGRHYYIMEYLAGAPLDEYLKSEGALSIDRALPILRGIARAVDAAHEHGIAHRDLKPDNVFLLEEDDRPPFPKLLDFGIAKLFGEDETHSHKTRTGAPIGTPLYMSPEQCRGKNVDHRTDIYAFGVLVYQVLVGRVPFDADNVLDILVMQMNDEPVPASQANPDLPAALDGAIRWMMAKSAGDRPPSLTDGLAALEDAARQSGMAVPEGGPVGSVHRASTHLPPLGHSGPAEPGGRAAPSAAALRGGRDDEPKGRRSGLVAAAAVTMAVAVAVAVVIVIASASTDESEPRAFAAVRSTTPAAGTSADAAARSPLDAALDGYVEVTIRGVPKGTEVFGPGGHPLGVAPGVVQLERNRGTVQLVLRAADHRPKTVALDTGEDAVLEVGLEPRSRPQPPPSRKPRSRRPERPTSRHSIEDPFR